jgi:glutaconate CoA-transferase subunit B
MILTALYPAVTVDDVKANVGWPLKARDRLAQVAPPTSEELRLLREVLDPRKLYLG